MTYCLTKYPLNVNGYAQSLIANILCVYVYHSKLRESPVKFLRCTHVWYLKQFSSIVLRFQAGHEYSLLKVLLHYRTCYLYYNWNGLLTTIVNVLRTTIVVVVI